MFLLLHSDTRFLRSEISSSLYQPTFLCQLPELPTQADSTISESTSLSASICSQFSGVGLNSSASGSSAVVENSSIITINLGVLSITVETLPLIIVRGLLEPSNSGISEPFKI